MESIALRSHVGSDGILKLEVPTDLTDADVEVTVTLRPVASASEPEPRDQYGWPVGFLEKTFGSIPDLVDVDEKYIDGKFVCEACYTARHDEKSKGS